MKLTIQEQNVFYPGTGMEIAVKGVKVTKHLQKQAKILLKKIKSKDVPENFEDFYQYLKNLEILTLLSNGFNSSQYGVIKAKDVCEIFRSN